jgi:FMN reductase
MTKHLTVVSAGLSQPSSTRLLADRLTEATVERLREGGPSTGSGSDTSSGTEVEVTVIELRDLAHDITNNLLTGFASPKLQEALDAVSEADGLIAVTPIFTTSYSGLFKSFIDVIDPNALTDLPVLIGATGGTERHSLALDYAMRPLFSYLHAVVVPTVVYAASSDWGSGPSTSSGTGLGSGTGDRSGNGLGSGTGVRSGTGLGSGNGVSSETGVRSESSSLSDRIGRAAGELAALIRDSERSGRVLDPFELPVGFSPVGGFGAQ